MMLISLALPRFDCSRPVALIHGTICMEPFYECPLDIVKELYRKGSCTVWKAFWLTLHYQPEDSALLCRWIFPCQWMTYSTIQYDPDGCRC